MEKDLDVLPHVFRIDLLLFPFGLLEIGEDVYGAAPGGTVLPEHGHRLLHRPRRASGRLGNLELLDEIQQQLPLGGHPAPPSGPRVRHEQHDAGFGSVLHIRQQRPRALQRHFQLGPIAPLDLPRHRAGVVDDDDGGLFAS